MIPDGRVGDAGEILEIEPQRRLVIAWRSEFVPELHAEGFSRVTYELAQQGDAVKLTLIQEIDNADSKLIGQLPEGWPTLFASLKSLLETGEPLEQTRRWPEGIWGHALPSKGTEET